MDSAPKGAAESYGDCTTIQLEPDPYPAFNPWLIPGWPVQVFGDFYLNAWGAPRKRLGFGARCLLPAAHAQRGCTLLVPLRSMHGRGSRMSRRWRALAAGHRLMQSISQLCLSSVLLLYTSQPPTCACLTAFAVFASLPHCLTSCASAAGHMFMPGFSVGSRIVNFAYKGAVFAFIGEPACVPVARSWRQPACLACMRAPCRRTVLPLLQALPPSGACPHAVSALLVQACARARWAPPPPTGCWRFARSWTPLTPPP